MTTTTAPFKPIGYTTLIFAAIFLFILPFPHTMALRLTALTATLGICTWLWFRQPRPPLPLKLPLLLWAVLAAASITWSIEPGISSKEFKHEVLFCLAAFFCFFILTRGLRELRFFITALMLAVATMSISGLYHWLPEQSWVQTGFQGGVGTFSTYMLLTLPMIALYAQLSESRNHKIFAASIAALAIMVTFLTLSRAFWPALTLEAIVILALMLFSRQYNYSTRFKKMAIAMLAAIIMATFIAFTYVVDQKKNHAKASTPSQLLEVLASDSRHIIWQRALERIKQAPWLGIGFGREITTRTETQKQIESLSEQRDEIQAQIRTLRTGKGNWPLIRKLRLDRSTLDIQLKELNASHPPWPKGLEHAHNTFVNYTIQLGIVGFLVITLLFGALLRLFLRAYQSKQPDAHFIAICMITLILGFLLKNMTDDFFRRDLALLFWSLCGMTLGYIHWQRFKEKNPITT